MNAALLALLFVLQEPSPTPVPVPAAELPALLDKLDATFAAFGKFRADYDVVGIPLGDDGPDLGKVVLYADIATSQSVFRMYATGEAEPTMQMQFDGWTGWGWRKKEPVVQKMDGTILARMVKTATSMGAGVDRLLGRQEDRAFHGQLNIRIDGKPAKDKKGNLRFALGTASGRHASWIVEIEAARDAVVRRAGNVVTADLPAARKCLAIDAETGLLKSLSARDYDDTVRLITLTSVAKGEAVPDLGRPAVVKSSLPPVDELALQVDEFCSGTWCGVPDLAKAWERIDADKKGAEAKALLSGFFGDVIHLWLDHALQSFARQYLAGRLSQGATPERLKTAADLEFDRFGASLAQDGPAKQLVDFVKDRAGRFQAALDKSLETGLAGVKERDALIKRTLEAACGDPRIDQGDALMRRARQAFDLVLAHAEEL